MTEPTKPAPFPLSALSFYDLLKAGFTTAPVWCEVARAINRCEEAIRLPATEWTYIGSYPDDNALVGVEDPNPIAVGKKLLEEFCTALKTASLAKFIESSMLWQWTYRTPWTYNVFSNRQRWRFTINSMRDELNHLLDVEAGAADAPEPHGGGLESPITEYLPPHSRPYDQTHMTWADLRAIIGLPEGFIALFPFDFRFASTITGAAWPLSIEIRVSGTGISGSLVYSVTLCDPYLPPYHTSWPDGWETDGDSLEKLGFSEQLPVMVPVPLDETNPVLSVEVSVSAGSVPWFEINSTYYDGWSYMTYSVEQVEE